MEAMTGNLEYRTHSVGGSSEDPDVGGHCGSDRLSGSTPKK